MNEYQLTWLGYELLGVAAIFGLAYLMAVLTEKKNKYK